MEYRRFEQVCVIRLDPGEDIVEQVRSVAEREQIHLAAVQGLGAVDDFTVGHHRQNLPRQPLSWQL